MDDSKLRFSVTEGSEVDPLAFRAFGRLCAVQRDFTGRCNSIVLVDVEDDDIIAELPRDISPGDITRHVRQAHAYWVSGYVSGRSEALLAVRRALGMLS